MNFDNANFSGDVAALKSGWSSTITEGLKFNIGLVGRDEKRLPEARSYIANVNEVWLGATTRATEKTVTNSVDRPR